MKLVAILPLITVLVSTPQSPYDDFNHEEMSNNFIQSKTINLSQDELEKQFNSINYEHDHIETDDNFESITIDTERVNTVGADTAMLNQLDNNKPDIPNQLTDQSQFDDSSEDEYTNYQWNYTKGELKVDNPHKSNGGRDVSAHSWWHRDEGKAQTASILVKLQIKKGNKWYNVASGYGVVKPLPRKTRKPNVNVRTRCIPSSRAYLWRAVSNGAINDQITKPGSTASSVVRLNCYS